LEINTKVDIDVAGPGTPVPLPAAGPPMLSLRVVTRMPSATLSPARPRSFGVSGRRAAATGSERACLWRAGVPAAALGESSGWLVPARGRATHQCPD
jgi:hypothetical protein